MLSKPRDICSVIKDLQAVADRINTGTDTPETSRALVVFNLTHQLLSGVAVFRADMAWPKDTPLPPVIISELEGEAVPSALTEWREGPDRKKRVDRRQVTFALRFAVRDVPAQGWRTYIASYTASPVPEADAILGDATPGLQVIETLRHGGDLAAGGARNASAALLILPLIPITDTQ